MINEYQPADFTRVYEIINDAAMAYEGIIPSDMWRKPYMPEEELKAQMEQGVNFWCFRENGEILGVMGIQLKGDVTLIRHAYVHHEHRNKGIGGQLLKQLLGKSVTAVLIGTWADAIWAVRFYQNHGFKLLSAEKKDKVLRKYWTIPTRQIETSVVLASADWQDT